jgi:hypothetical protein
VNKDERRAAYAQKLKDPRWQKRRLEILSRDEFACALCGDSENTLHVHHIAYTTEEPWNAPDHQLVTLCASCHDAETAALYEALKTLGSGARAFGLMSGGILAIAEAFAGSEPLHQPDVVADAIAVAIRNPAEQRRLIAAYFDHLAEKRSGA